MTTARMGRFLEQIRADALLDAECVPDGQLLDAFLRVRDEAALTALVRRHAQMVWGVCQRLLHNHADAEDAFQATFLVLVRKASTLRDGDAVGNWLHGVARQTATRMRSLSARRDRREKSVEILPDAPTLDPPPWEDLGAVLDEEVGRLPEKYRVLIVLCDLESRTRKDVASLLKVPEGTVAGRLARARERLAERLTRRGVTIGATALAALLPLRTSATVPVPLLGATIRSATLLASGSTAETLSPTVYHLMTGVMRTMSAMKYKVMLTALLSGILLVGVGWNATAQQKTPTRTEPARTVTEPVQPKAAEEHALHHSLEIHRALKGAQSCFTCHADPKKPDLPKQSDEEQRKVDAEMRTQVRKAEILEAELRLLKAKGAIPEEIHLAEIRVRHAREDLELVKAELARRRKSGL